MDDIRRVTVLGVPVDAIDIPGSLARVDTYIATQTVPGYIAAVNPEKVQAALKDPDLKRFLENATYLIPDGIGVVLAMRLLWGVRVRRAPGVDLMHGLCDRSAEAGHRIFIFGSREDVSKRACDELTSRYPGMRLVGRSNGYVTPDEMPMLVERINGSGADILFVGLGSPRQEEWISEHLPRLKVKVCQGIGGTLDTIAGTIRRAPRAWQALGLEWLYRLIRQPWRIWRQLTLLSFAWRVFAAWLGRRAHGLFTK